MTERRPNAAAADLPALAARVRRLRAAGADPVRRTLVGIAGPPGAGKSTLAAALVAELGPTAVLVCLDGFHLAQAVLDRHGTQDIKGAPETFDPSGYLALLGRLRHTPRESVYAPHFDRSIEEPIAGAVQVDPSVDIVVTEGNYLLISTPPWDRIADLLDECWYLDVPEPTRLDRLVSRHVVFGRSRDAALRRATEGADGANARLVAACRSRADLIVTDAPLRPADRVQ